MSLSIDSADGAIVNALFSSDVDKDILSGIFFEIEDERKESIIFDALERAEKEARSDVYMPPSLFLSNERRQWLEALTAYLDFLTRFAPDMAEQVAYGIMSLTVNGAIDVPEPLFHAVNDIVGVRDGRPIH